MEEKQLREKVKESLFQKQHFTNRKKERMLENILLAHYGNNKKKRNLMLEWMGILACISLLVIATVSVTGISLDSPEIHEGSLDQNEAPYISAAYLKRASEIAHRDLDISDAIYFSIDSTVYLDLMVSDKLSEQKMKELATEYLGVLSHLYQTENEGINDIWNHYHVEVTIKGDREYPSTAYFDEADESYYLKGSKRKKETTIQWYSTSQ
ncbi:hypothetical protein [Bacillus sp. Cs-700]|uniref:hypothetical protein n=1 Tax=Bacillus sp. Cs-700 TaxID=2589818 RepID=UPI00140CBE9C|nr:hypothetical protein [Bacillus sp. Cs-700]